MRSLKNEFVFFSLSGVAGFIVNAGIVFSLTKAGFDPFSSQAIAFSIAVTTTWLINRRFTFAHYANQNWIREWMHYVVANSIGAVVNNATYVALVLSMAQFSREPVLAVAAGSIAGLFFNFIASRTLVFRVR